MNPQMGGDITAKDKIQRLVSARWVFPVMNFTTFNLVNLMECLLIEIAR